MNQLCRISQLQNWKLSQMSRLDLKIFMFLSYPWSGFLMVELNRIYVTIKRAWRSFLITIKNIIASNWMSSVKRTRLKYRYNWINFFPKYLFTMKIPLWGDYMKLSDNFVKNSLKVCQFNKLIYSYTDKKLMKAIF